MPGMLFYMDLTHSEGPVFFRAAGAVKLIKLNRKTETVRSLRSGLRLHGNTMNNLE